MSNESFERFKEEYLIFFRNRYKNYRTSRKELKRSIFENPRLNEKQKQTFWDLVTN